MAVGAPRNEATLYPEDYGAVGDGVTDDTDAIQSCIDAMADVSRPTAGTNGGIVQFGPKTYLVNGPSFVNGVPKPSRGPTPAGGGYSMLRLPYSTNSNAQHNVRLQGVPRQTIIKSTYSGFAGDPFSATYGCPSVIGGRTPEQALADAASSMPGATSAQISQAARNDFSAFGIAIADINVVLPSNPSLSAIDLSRHRRASAERVNVSTTLPDAIPYKPNAFGIRMPQGLNSGRNTLDQVTATGFYVGLVGFTAHLQISQARIAKCVIGLGTRRS
ncbi:MAG: hypothetical protein IPK93_04605 [Solirubrobacterales bacterium]|nr:hypothetical protein [Solirubrobacterales bacterium]